MEIFDVELFQCNWYAYPIETQKLLLTFMSSTQRSKILHGFGNIQCTRNAFKSVNLDLLKNSAFT